MIVGIDAGGTGSRAVLVRDGVVVGRRDLGPINVLLHADAVDRLAAAIEGADGAGLGLAGLRSAEDGDRIAAELTGRTGVRVAVGDDTDAALAGAFAGGPGIVVIAGTGSGAAGRAVPLASAAGRDGPPAPAAGRDGPPAPAAGRDVPPASAAGRDGRPALAGGPAGHGPAGTLRVGGHGFLLGDEGGGYWIGRQAVSAALRAADGTGPATALTALVEEAFGSLVGAEQQVHRAPADRELLARLVPAVAATDDPVAAGILAAAGAHLADLADALRARLGPLPVAGVGGIFRCAPVRAAFLARTGGVDPLEPPELGALRLL